MTDQAELLQVLRESGEALAEKMAQAKDSDGALQEFWAGLPAGQRQAAVNAMIGAVLGGGLGGVMGYRGRGEGEGLGAALGPALGGAALGGLAGGAGTAGLRFLAGEDRLPGEEPPPRSLVDAAAETVIGGALRHPGATVGGAIGGAATLGRAPTPSRIRAYLERTKPDIISPHTPQTFSSALEKLLIRHGLVDIPELTGLIRSSKLQGVTSEELQRELMRVLNDPDAKGVTARVGDRLRAQTPGRGDQAERALTELSELAASKRSEPALARLQEIRRTSPGWKGWLPTMRLGRGFSTPSPLWFGAAPVGLGIGALVDRYLRGED